MKIERFELFGHGATGSNKKGCYFCDVECRRRVERSSDKEFQRFLFIAKGSAGELRSQLFLAIDLQYITVHEFEHGKSQAEEVSKTLSAFITYLYGDKTV